METSIMSPIMQWGFAGFSGILLSILVWLIRELLKVLKENNRIIASNTEAINRVGGSADSTLQTVSKLKDELYRRPCVARG